MFLFSREHVLLFLLSFLHFPQRKFEVRWTIPWQSLEQVLNIPIAKAESVRPSFSHSSNKAFSIGDSCHTERFLSIRQGQLTPRTPIPLSRNRFFPKICIVRERWNMILLIIEECSLRGMEHSMHLKSRALYEDGHFQLENPTELSSLYQTDRALRYYEHKGPKCRSAHRNRFHRTGVWTLQ